MNVSNLTKKEKEEIMEMVKNILEGRSYEPAKPASAFDPNQAKSVHSALLDAKVALEDYYEIDENGDKKIKFTFNEVLEISKKLPEGWHVATRHEWCLLAEEFGNNPETGRLDPDRLAGVLNLTRDEDGFGRYWSSTAYNANDAYYLTLDSSNVYPQNNNLKYLGFTVRCVSDS